MDVCEKWPRTLGRLLDDATSWGRSEDGRDGVVSRVLRLDARICCELIVPADDGGPTLERGVRGKKDSRANARDVASIPGEDGPAGEFERLNARLMLRNEGEMECLDLWVRWGMGVTGTWNYACWESVRRDKGVKKRTSFNGSSDFVSSGMSSSSTRS